MSNIGLSGAPSLKVLAGAAALAGGFLWYRSRAGKSKKVSTTDYVRGGDSTSVPTEELLAITRDCLVAAGATKEHAAIVADVLVNADARGVPSHGVNRLEMYVGELEHKVVDGKAKPKEVTPGTKSATAMVDGKNALGHVVGKFAMELAMKKAKEFGVGWVVCNNSNHFGIAGYYSAMAERDGMVAMSFTNTSPFVVPTRAKPGDFSKDGGGTALGTNAISMAAPSADGDGYMMDMASCVVPIGKVEVCHRKQQPLPLGWGVDRHGEPCTDPEEVMLHGALLPLGGAEETAGYKGYALALMVEIFTSLLGDGAVGPEVQKWRANRAGPLNYAHCFVAIDPARFVPGFDKRMAKFCNQLRSLPTAVNAPGPVMVPGDPERENERRAQSTGKVGVHPNVLGSIKVMATRLGVNLPPSFDAIKGKALEHLLAK